jgi:hypothetical protein
MAVLESFEEIEKLILANRETRGIVLFCTLFGCPSCIIAEPEWSAFVVKFCGSRKFQREQMTARDQNQEPLFSQNQEPLFIKVFAPVVRTLLHKLKPTAVPAILLFGPESYETTCAVRDLEKATETLCLKVEAHREKIENPCSLLHFRRPLLGRVQSAAINSRRVSPLRAALKQSSASVFSRGFFSRT